MAREPLRRRSEQALEWPRLLEHLARNASTREGAQACRALEPAADAGTARRRQAETTEARALCARGATFDFEGVQDLSDVVRRVRMEALLDSDELLGAARTLRCSRLIKQTITEARQYAPLLYELSRRLISAKGVEHEILQRFDDQGKLLDSASPELERLRLRLRRLREEINETFERLLDSPDVSAYLQERLVTVRSGRYVIPIKIEHKGKVEGIVHDISSSGASLFIEPREVTRLGNELRTCELQIQQEEARILRELTGRVAEVLEGLLAAVDCLVELDAITARALLAERLRASEPELCEGGGISLRAARHPLLVLAGDEVVPNDLEIEPAVSTLVISGPNTGGKTVQLKTLGLFALMSRAGLHLPCGSGSRLPLFDAVFADIGDEQSLEAHLSSFSAHLENIRDILAEAGPASLVLLDEVGEGTEPRQGVALAIALLELLARRGCNTLVTTHFIELAALAETRPGFCNASVEFDEATLSPTFRFVPRLPGRSSALAIARRLGLPHELLERAAELTDAGAGQVEQAVERLDRERQQLIELTRRAALDAEQASAERERQREITRKLRERREQLARNAAAGIRREADRARDKIKAALAAFQTGPSDRAATAARTEIREVERWAEQVAPAQQTRTRIESVLIQDWSRVAPGAEVVVAPLNARGRLVALPDQRGKVRVQLGAALVTLGSDDVALPAAPAQGGSERVTRIGGAFEFDLASEAEQHESSRLDLRGLDAEEALAQTETFLDRAVRAGLRRVTVIHGHGTGVLKSLVRERLSGSPYVHAWRPGERGEGGDGVAVVDLGPGDDEQP